jgi:lysozyme
VGSGDGAGTEPSGAVESGLGTSIRALATGKEHTCALVEDGTVHCWGANTLGELGDPTRAAHDDPIAVAGAGDGVAMLAAGDSFSCLLRTDGSLACWGWDLIGQLGDGGGEATADAFAAVRPPRAVGLEKTATAIATGYGHACALAVDATVWCWGMNHRGQLGDGSLDDSFRPVEVAAPGGSTPDLLAGGVGVEAPQISGGIDVSYHSGAIPWPEVAAGEHDFAFTLGTAGLTFLDPLFDYHWTHLRRNGLRRGVYHFFVLHDDAEEQARFFIDNVPLTVGDLRPVVDIETLGDDPPADVAGRLATFVRLLEEHYGAKPIIYTGPVFWDTYVSDAFGEHPLWIAEYGVDAPRIPKGWETWHLWQWKGNATVGTTKRVVDLNRFNREGVAFDELLLGSVEKPESDE